jgi:hypothetical protein
MVVFFLRFPEYWDCCIRQVVCSLCLGRVIPDAELPQIPSSDKVLKAADSGRKIPALWFSAILVEEVGKVDAKNIKKWDSGYDSQPHPPQALFSFSGRVLTDTSKLPFL